MSNGSMVTSIELVVGVDFAGPSKESEQKRKIVAVAAFKIGKRRYEIRKSGFNSQLLKSSPGWAAKDLLEKILQARSLSVLAGDFPFSIPVSLMNDPGFSSIIGLPGA